MRVLIGHVGRASLVFAGIATTLWVEGAAAQSQPGYYPPQSGYQPNPAQQPYQPNPAQPYPGQPYPGQPSQAYPTQPYPSQSSQYPAQPYPSQSSQYPAQPYPSQSYQYPTQPNSQPYAAQPYRPMPGPSSAVWVPTNGGALPPGAVYGGAEDNGAVEYVCQAIWAGGLHPGKAWNGHCYIAYGQTEVKLPTYNVLVDPSARWSAPNLPGAIPVVGGHEGNHDFHVCRGQLFVDGRRIGIEVGKYFSSGCQVSYGRAYYIRDFEELYAS